MKKLLIICTLAGMAYFAEAQTVENFNFRRVDKTKVPVEVTGAAERDFADGSITEYFAVPAEYTKEDWLVSSNATSSTNPDYYSVSVEKNGNTYYALYNKMGKKIATQVKVKDVPLPDKISKDIQKKYPGYTIQSDKYTRLVSETDKKAYYRVTISKDNTVKHLFYKDNGSPAK
jgi:hypothetical protein